MLAIPCNVTDQKAVESLFSKVKSEVEKLDVLICNVGGMKHPGAGLKIGDMKPEEWWGDIVSLSGFAFRDQSLMPILGIELQGHIPSCSSVHYSLWRNRHSD